VTLPALAIIEYAVRQVFWKILRMTVEISSVTVTSGFSYSLAIRNAEVQFFTEAPPGGTGEVVDVKRGIRAMQCQRITHYQLRGGMAVGARLFGGFSFNGGV
jgi:hypothetical protein